MPLGFPSAAISSAFGFAAAEGDIFVASYPKCGTTWLQYIVYQLVSGQSLGSDDTLSEVFPHLEEVGAVAVTALSSPRLIKTHLLFAQTPYSDSARYLVIARNPFDCAVSFYHHTRGFPRHYDFADGSFSVFFDCFISGEVDFGDWFDHFASWRAEAERGNVLWLTYEQLREDPGGRIGDIARFIQPGVAPDPARVDMIVAEASLDSMRRDQQRWSSKRPDWAPGFVRSGSVDGWQEYFTPAMARALLAKCERCLGPRGLAEIWPGIAATAHEFANSGR